MWFLGWAANGWWIFGWDVVPVTCASSPSSDLVSSMDWWDFFTSESPMMKMVKPMVSCRFSTNPLIYFKWKKIPCKLWICFWKPPKSLREGPSKIIYNYCLFRAAFSVLAAFFGSSIHELNRSNRPWAKSTWVGGLLDWFMIGLLSYTHYLVPKYSYHGRFWAAVSEIRQFYHLNWFWMGTYTLIISDHQVFG